ncbi:AcrR family transcriptional regulator [Amycolatopsis bartoniae]|uniref:TetR family transcriptional regulator n=1 Tax=Amycolatopsis bartoniae TaxID=941986 RepID=UPI001193EA77|nr:TetR family transcriptional regulator [Amycolatopsis bartoniae]MBB2934164.1 AcrR family transcriptional regulator [Amycolatopsis bartoniae]TVT05534.1 TetR family transcriptional regulator [Amycolatopsis bartoniae]
MTAEPVTRHERKERTRRALLDAALGLLADRGFASLSLREVTKVAGIVPTAFYRHFASMDELGVALVEESMRTLRDMIRSVRRGRNASGDMIRESVRTLYEQVRAHENHFRFLVRERYGGGGAVSRAVAVELKLFSSELAVDLARLDFLREWSTEDLHMMAELIVTAMQATVLDLLEARPRDAGTDERIVRTAEKRLRLIALGVPSWRSRT